MTPISETNGTSYAISDSSFVSVTIAPGVQWPITPSTTSASSTFGLFGSITSSDPNIATVTFPDKDKIKSDEGETFKHGHKIQGQLCIEFDKVVVKFRCSECGEVVAEKDIFKVPKKIRNAKCLVRLVKEI